VVENRGLTGEAVGAAATNDVEGGNGGSVGEGVPSLASELHTSVEDIRQSLDGNKKHRGESSQAAVELVRVICGGRRRD
jgi:hypothetical protein